MKIIESLSLEIYKFRRNPSITTLLLLFLILTPIASLISSEISQLQDSLPLKSESIMDFPQIWNWMGYLGSWTGFFFLGVIAIYITTTEISYKTLRQGIINGQTRKEFFISKLGVITFLALAATIYYILWTLIFGAINAENFSLSNAFSNEYAIPRYLLMNLGFMFFAFFLGMMIKRSGLAVFLYLSYVMAIEPIWRWGIHKKIIGSSFMNYYPMNLTEDLMPNPVYKLAEKFPDKDLGMGVLSYTEASIGTILFCIFFVGLSYYSFTRRDL